MQEVPSRRNSRQNDVNPLSRLAAKIAKRNGIDEEQPEEKAAQIGGAAIKRILEDPKLNKLAEIAAQRVEKLPLSAKAIVAAAFLGKMGLTADDLESIKSQIPRLMNQDPEPQPEK